MRENRTRLKDLSDDDKTRVLDSDTDWDTIAPLVRVGVPLETAIDLGESRNRQGFRTDLTESDADLLELGVPLELVVRLAASNQDSREAVILLTRVLTGELKERIGILDRIEKARVPLSLATHAVRHYKLAIETIEQVADRFGPRAALVHYVAVAHGATLDDLAWLVRHDVSLADGRIGGDEWAQLASEPDVNARRLSMLMVLKETMPVTWARAVAVSHKDPEAAELLARLIADRTPLDQAVEATRALNARPQVQLVRSAGARTRQESPERGV